MSEVVTKDMAMKYEPTSIVYLDHETVNFVVLFHNVNDLESPAVRVVVKYENAGTIGAVTATVSTLHSSVTIADEASELLKNKAIEAVQTLCKYEYERVVTGQR